MEIGGIALIAVVVLIFAILPHVIQRRNAIMESREADRFSPDLQLVDFGFSSACPSVGRHRLISQRTQICHVSGGNMGTQTDAHDVSVNTGMKARAHEIAQLRARRAARRSVEAAAGQRRMVGAGIFAALTLVASVVVYVADAVTWPVILLPALGFGAVIAWSRRAAIIAEQADQRDRDRLAQLRRVLPQNVSAEYCAPVELREDVSESVADELSAEAPLAEGNPVEDAQEEVVAAQVESSDSQGSKGWIPAALPPSRYSQGARIAGRVVHADTDLRGIPRVSAAVPARPVAPTADENLRSTQDVAASVPVAFDLEEILEARRA